MPRCLPAHFSFPEGFARYPPHELLGQDKYILCSCLLSMVLFLSLFPAPALGLWASRCGKLSKGGPGSARSAKAHPVFLNNSPSARRMSPGGSPRQPSVGRRTWQRLRASRMEGIKLGRGPLLWCDALCQDRHPSKPRRAGGVSCQSLAAPSFHEAAGAAAE